MPRFTVTIRETCLFRLTIGAETLEDAEREAELISAEGDFDRIEDFHSAEERDVIAIIQEDE